MPRKIIAGNWKMNHDLPTGLQLIEAVADYLRENVPQKVEVVMATPYLHLAEGRKIAQDTPITLAAQDCSAHEEGAYTGEVSTGMLASAGTELVIVGHSERRQYHAENDALLRQKLERCWEKGLLPILCVGEREEDRDAGRQKAVVRKQLEGALEGCSEHQLENLVIAYEPVWAIGTGRTATPEEAQDMHQFIRQYLIEAYSATLADEASLLYGGSLKPANAHELLRQPDIDGGLIGGASLKAADFCALIKAGEELLR
jgi:triosephosphate isomerase